MSGHIPEGATTPPKTFTPGPWRVSNLDARVIGPVRILRDKDSATEIQQILAVARVTERLQETEPNARLIAAAPDLLETCRIVLGHLDGSTGEVDAVSILQQVIAKAEGREHD